MAEVHVVNHGYNTTKIYDASANYNNFYYYFNKIGSSADL